MISFCLSLLCANVCFLVQVRKGYTWSKQFHRTANSWLGAPFPKAQFKNVGYYGTHSLPEDWDLNYSGAADPYKSYEKPTPLLWLGDWAAQDLNEASALGWICRDTPFSWLCIQQFECRLNGPESLSAGSTTGNIIVVSSVKHWAPAEDVFSAHTNQASVCCTGTLSLHSAFLWAQPPTAVKHSRFWENIIKHFGFSYFVAK